MKYIAFCVLGYLVLYSVVWLHEIGHSFFEAMYGGNIECWNVEVKPYIFFSTPGPLYEEAVQNWTKKEFVMSAYGGIISNMFFTFCGSIVMENLNTTNEYIWFVVCMFTTLHAAEVVSYLLVGSIYLVSDMKMVNQYMPILRIPNIIFGALFTVCYVFILKSIPESFRVFVIVWNVITIISMCAGRIVFSIRAEKKLKQAS